MRLLCAHFPAFPLQVAMRSRPAIGPAKPGRGGPGAKPLETIVPAPLAVADSLIDPSGRREAPANSPLLAVSQAARTCGARAGMTVAQARAACPDLVVRPVDPAAHEVARIAIGEVMSGFGPLAEVEGGADPRVPDCAAWVDVTGERREEKDLAASLVRELEMAGFMSRVSAAGNRFTARAVAACERDPAKRIVAAGDEREALAALPVSALPLDERAGESFRRLGLRALGDIARLPADALARRFTDATRWSALARGEDPSPLAPFRIPPVLFEKIDLPAPVMDLEPLLFSLKTILDRVCARLAGRGASAAKLALHLVLDRGDEAAPSATLDVRLPRPTVVSKTILEVARERLSRTRLPGPVVELAVEVVDALPTRRTQLELFGKAPPAPERIAVTLGRLATAFGGEAVFSAALTEEHRPESAFRPEPFDAAEKKPQEKPKEKKTRAREKKPDHAPPAIATPRAEGCDRPVRLLQEPEDVRMSGQEIVVRGRRLAIVALVGPERLSGEWWEEQEFDRDYYRVHTEEGSRWWIYLDRAHESWHLHGLFD